MKPTTTTATTLIQATEYERNRLPQVQAQSQAAALHGSGRSCHLLRLVVFAYLSPIALASKVTCTTGFPVLFRVQNALLFFFLS